MSEAITTIRVKDIYKRRWWKDLVKKVTVALEDDFEVINHFLTSEEKQDITVQLDLGTNENTTEIVITIMAGE